MTKILRVNAPIREQTLQYLKSAIVDGKFKPGRRLYERELSESIGVSRTTIREVLRHLESEGLVKVIPQKGPIVATVTIEEGKDIDEVREFLEGLACRLFAERGAANAMSALGQSMALLEKYVQDGDTDKQIAESNRFYEIIMEGCGNRVVYSLLSSLRARINFLRAITLLKPGRPLESIKELRRIYEALEKHDAAAAWEATTYHVSAAKEYALQYLSDLNRTNSISNSEHSNASNLVSRIKMDG